MKTLFYTLLLVLLAVNCYGKVKTVPTLNVTLYLGVWYQVYSDNAVDETFEKDNYCVNATYGLNKNGTISVLNQARIGGVNGKLDTIRGWVEQKDPNEPGQLTVHLDGVPADAPYWITLLGPNQDSYEYAVVTNPSQVYLFVLARNVSDYFAKYNTTVMNFLKEEGFDHFWDYPVPTVQQGC